MKIANKSLRRLFSLLLLVRAQALHRDCETVLDKFMFQMRIYRMHKLSLHLIQIKRVKTKKNGLHGNCIMNH